MDNLIVNNLDNLRKVYFDVKEKTNEILSQYNDKNFLIDPSVNIYAIAKMHDVKIIYVKPEEIGGRHAKLEVKPDGTVIKVNKKDSIEEQRFSIAHDLEHYLKKKADMFKIAESKKIVNSLNKNNLNEIRSAANFRSVNKKIPKQLKIPSTKIAETVSTKLWDKTTAEKAYRAMITVLINSGKKIKKEAIVDATIDELYNEEVADLFAANLLVPTERFLLWADKSDRKIAKVFKVPKSCIKKRRKEIVYELELMTPNKEDVEKGLALLNKSDHTSEDFKDNESTQC